MFLRHVFPVHERRGAVLQGSGRGGMPNTLVSRQDGPVPKYAFGHHILSSDTLAAKVALSGREGPSPPRHRSVSPQRPPGDCNLSLISQGPRS